MDSKDNVIYVCEELDPISGLPLCREVMVETIFPTKEPKYSLYTRLRWKLAKILKR